LEIPGKIEQGNKLEPATLGFGSEASHFHFQEKWLTKNRRAYKTYPTLPELRVVENRFGNGFVALDFVESRS